MSGSNLKSGIILFSIILLAGAAVDVDLVNKNVDRTIDLTSQIVSINYKITLDHLNKRPITSYSFALSTKERENLAFIQVKDSSKRELKYTESKSSTGATYTIALPSSSSQNPVLYIETVFTKSLYPYPTEIAQSERQLVRYFGNVYFSSPYKTVNQKTTIHLATRTIESFTHIKPVQHSDRTLVYGPFENVEANKYEEIVIHYENHTPFLTVTRLERTIEISHWGNIAIEETIDMVHSGAVLKGPFSRYEFQKDNRFSQSSVKSYKTVLPASANGVYYRDNNGNISTSAMRNLKDSVELELRPRFPLFGGWRTHYTIGYNVPSYEYLFNSGNQYALKMRLIDHIFDNMAIDEAEIKIILPEGCTNIKLTTPYPVERLPDSVHYTYLDTVGRPVIIFRKENLVDQHISDFTIKYNFSKTLMLQEPLLVVGFIYLLFLIVIICMRLDFSIIKDQREHQHKD